MFAESIIIECAKADLWLLIDEVDACRPTTCLYSLKIMLFPYCHISSHGVLSMCCGSYDVLWVLIPFEL